MSEKLYTLHDAAKYLSVSDEEVRLLVREGRLVAYKIGGAFLRFKKLDLDAIKPDLKDLLSQSLPDDYSLSERIKDFIYFNDFYIASGVIILAVVWIIMKA